MSRIKRPKTRTVCTHCLRRREPKFIEWHPGIVEWQCSNFTDCDRVIDENLAQAYAASELSKLGRTRRVWSRSKGYSGVGRSFQFPYWHL